MQNLKFIAAKVLCVALLAAVDGASHTGDNHAAVGAIFFVSPSGSDSNNGLTAALPFQTLERAQSAMEALGSETATTYLASGIYTRNAPLNLTSYYDQNKSWIAAAGAKPVLDGHGTTPAGINVSGNGITIEGLTIRNFMNSGIFAQYAAYLRVADNSIVNITSPDWRTGVLGASIFFLNVQNSLIVGNAISGNTYTGIQVNAGGGGDNNSSDVVEYNLVINTCTAIVDCGAVYVRDVPHVSTNQAIKWNLIGNFGSRANDTKAIYLDDEASNVRVEYNTIYGQGTYCLEIHGGNNNLIRNNIFNISATTKLALYQDDVSSGGLNYGMADNTFEKNIVYSSAPPPNTLWDYINQSNTSIALPTDTGSLYYDPSGPLPNGGTIVDAQPLPENPEFEDPSRNNYRFSPASPALSLGFLITQ